MPQRRSTGSRAAQHRLTCANCRGRKVKCDGTTPECRICQAHGMSCHYDKPPPMSQVLAMAKQIEALERALHVAEGRATPPSDTTSTDRVQQHQASAHKQLRSPEASASVRQHPSPPEPILQLQSPRADQASLQHQSSAPTFPSTSAVEALASHGHDTTTTSLPDPLAVTHSSPMTAEQLAMWQSKASEVCAVQLHLPRQQVDHLFETYWTWVAPSFMFVSRPHFLMSTAGGGCYSSPLLRAVICLQATRFTESALKEQLLALIHSLFGQEIHRAPTLPLVQALLQLSAREIGNGSLNQAWLYSGMAFRIALDMGIMVRCRGSQIDATDTAIRGQLAWSCFLWDKTISLYLGRAPSLPEAPNFDPVLLDKRIENALWVPYFGAEASNSLTPSISHGITCFNHFCKLGTIINDVLQTIYAKKTGSDVLTFVEHTWERLKTWRLSSPQHLIISPGSQSCPAPHIVSQNMVYYITTILLHRPFRNNNECRSICRQASAEVEHLLLLLERCMGLTHVTYIMAYCAYTAATVAMLELYDGVEGSQARVNTFLRALYCVRTSCPGIQRSIDIIIKGLEHVPYASSSTASTIDVSHNPLPQPPDPLPVFPVDGSEIADDWNLDGQTAMPFGSLDPYAIDWTLLTDDAFNWDWQV